MFTDHQFSHLFHQDQVQQQMDRKDEEVKTMREAHQGTTKDFVCCWWNDNQTISIWNLDPTCLIWIRRPICWPIIWYWLQNVTSCFTCGQHWKVFHSMLFHVFSRCGTWLLLFLFLSGLDLDPVCHKAMKLFLTWFWFVLQSVYSELDSDVVTLKAVWTVLLRTSRHWIQGVTHHSTSDAVIGTEIIQNNTMAARS